MKQLSESLKQQVRLLRPAQESVASESLNDGTRAEFIAAMSRRVSTVNLVTTDGDHGRFGLTVTSMASVSADPPLLMIGINRKSPLCGAITLNRRFAINALAVDQQRLADSFAGFDELGRNYDFSLADWTRGRLEQPLLCGATAQFECVLLSRSDAGSHRLFIGRVLNAASGQSPALCYSERDYKCAASLA